MTRFILDAVYLLAAIAGSPVWLYRMARHGRYRSAWGERLGGVPVRYGLQPIIWVHGVSLGEVNAARSLVAELHSQLPDFRVVVSTTTETGMAAATRLFAPDHMVFHWPLDFSLCVRRALARMRPDLVVLMEGEAWPNFLAACTDRGVPVVVVNARMSADKGYPRYKAIAPLARRLMFSRLAAVGVQDAAYAERFEYLGVPPERIHLTGMMKYDTAVIGDAVDGSDALSAAIGLAGEHRLVVAGGTGPGEEKMLLDIWAALAGRHPRARLAIVPRKPERFDEVAALIASCGFKTVRRSRTPDGRNAAAPLSGDAVVLGDTMGELRKFYSLAECVFVGRSLVPMGGSDMIESAALARATAFGPHTFNFPQADRLAANGCVRLADADALREQLDAWLGDPADAAEAGRRAQEFVRGQTGATRRNVEMICGVLGRVPAAAPGAIATDAVRE
jgi:3-deoxy-D-manno-octulosonic-acid transferase